MATRHRGVRPQVQVGPTASQVRDVLEPLSEMAERLRVAFLTVTHFAKRAGNNTKALRRFIGSISGP